MYLAGQVLKRSLATFSDKVDGQQAMSEKKAKLLYSALDAHPESYKARMVYFLVVSAANYSVGVS